MNHVQRRDLDNVRATTGRSDGYDYASGLWEAANAVSAHVADCTLSHHQIRLASLSTPLAAQVPVLVDVLGHARLVDAVSIAPFERSIPVGNFCKVCMMANVVRAMPQDSTPVKLKDQDR